MHAVMSTRGPFMVCDSCFKMLKDTSQLNPRGAAVNDQISEDFCPNCFDLNRPLIDDLAGSTE